LSARDRAYRDDGQDWICHTQPLGAFNGSWPGVPIILFFDEMHAFSDENRLGGLTWTNLESQ